MILDIFPIYFANRIICIICKVVLLNRKDVFILRGNIRIVFLFKGIDNGNKKKHTRQIKTTLRVIIELAYTARNNE